MYDKVYNVTHARTRDDLKIRFGFSQKPRFADKRTEFRIEKAAAKNTIKRIYTTFVQTLRVERIATKRNRRRKRNGRRCFNFGSDGFNGEHFHFIEHIPGRSASRNSSGHWKFIGRLST